MVAYAVGDIGHVHGEPLAKEVSHPRLQDLALYVPLRVCEPAPGNRRRTFRGACHGGVKSFLDLVQAVPVFLLGDRECRPDACDLKCQGGGLLAHAACSPSSCSPRSGRSPTIASWTGSDSGTRTSDTRTSCSGMGSATGSFGAIPSRWLSRCWKIGR